MVSNTQLLNQLDANRIPLKLQPNLLKLKPTQKSAQPSNSSIHDSQDPIYIVQSSQFNKLNKSISMSSSSVTCNK